MWPKIEDEMQAKKLALLNIVGENVIMNMKLRFLLEV